MPSSLQPQIKPLYGRDNEVPQIGGRWAAKNLPERGVRVDPVSGPSPARFSLLLLVLSEAVLVILIDHPPPSGYAVFSEIGAHLDFDYRFAEHR
jgi:hypothetical protein